VKTLKRDSRRSKLEIYIDIMRVLAQHGPLKLTHIMYKSNVNCTVLKQFLDFLCQQNLVEEQILRKRKAQKITYAITERGRTALNYFKEIKKALQTNEETQSPYVFI
jgi:predicted transcriptional regulator